MKQGRVGVNDRHERINQPTNKGTVFSLLKWTDAEKEKNASVEKQMSLWCLGVLEWSENSAALTQSEGAYLCTYLCAATIVRLFVCTPGVLSTSALH